MLISGEQKRVYNSIFYLTYILLKENWKIVLGILLFFLLIWTPLIYFLTKDDGGNTGYFLISTWLTLPVFLIATIILPIIHEQINSSSIKMRMKASGLSFRFYAISIILFFTIILIALFYLMLPIFALLFREITSTEMIGWEGGQAIYENRIQYHMTFNFVNTLFLVPITILGLVSIGYLIASLKVNEIIKGILIIFLIFFTLVLNQGVANPLVGLTSNPEHVTTFLIKSKITAYNMLLVNPFGTIIYTMQTSVNSKMFWSGQYSSFEFIEESLMLVGTSTKHLLITTQIIGCVYSFTFFALSILISKK